MRRLVRDENASRFHMLNDHTNEDRSTNGTPYNNIIYF